MSFTYPVSKKLIRAILEDRLSDHFVCEMVWERLGYERSTRSEQIWVPTSSTPKEWREKFPESPAFIAERKASVFLTRSVSVQYKQLLKLELDFEGYSIQELYPRRTRRCTAANWLLAWVKVTGHEIPDEASMPSLLPIPHNPLKGHPGDLEVQ